MTRLGMLAVVVLAPSAALAADEGGGVGTLLWHAFNLVLLLAVIVHFARAPARSFFSERRRTIAAQIRDATEQLDEAEAKLSRWQSRLDELDREITELRDRVREQAEAEAARILDQAQDAAERIRHDARAGVEHETERARTRLHAEIGALAVEVADSLLRDHVNDDDRGRLVDDFVDRVERTAQRDGAAQGG